MVMYKGWRFVRLGFKRWRVMYKGWRFVPLGFKRWRVTSPNKDFHFVIIFKDGISELISRTDLWMEVINGNN